jgi:hypothetical protein
MFSATARGAPLNALPLKMKGGYSFTLVTGSFTVLASYNNLKKTGGVNV